MIRVGIWPLRGIVGVRDAIEVPYGTELLTVRDWKGQKGDVIGLYDDRQRMRERVEILIAYVGDGLPDQLGALDIGKRLLGTAALGTALVFELGRERWQMHPGDYVAGFGLLCLLLVGGGLYVAARDARAKFRRDRLWLRQMRVGGSVSGWRR